MACMQDTKCFTLPTSIAASSVTNIQIQINYQSPTSGSQTWTWKIYDWVHSAYITVGTNAGAPEWGAWKLLTFSVSGTLSHYIRSSDGQVRVQLVSTNSSDSADIDYQLVAVVYDPRSSDLLAVGSASSKSSVSTGDLTIF